MAALKIGIVFLAALCLASGEVASRCDVTVRVDYPVDSAPSPFCSFACDDSSPGLSFTGAVYSRFSALQLNFQRMVKINFSSGRLSSCTLVPYQSDKQLQEESIDRRAAENACTRIQPTLPTTAAPEPTTSAPEPTTFAPEPTTFAPEPTTFAPEPTTSAPEPTTEAPEPTTEAPEPTTSAPEPTTSAPEPTTPEPTTTSTTTPESTTVPTTTTTTTLAPITYWCPYGFTQYGGSCYREFTSATNWARALSYCRLYGATLVRINSYSEYIFVTSIAGKKRVWTDANDIRSEKKHVFSDNETDAYLRWAKNEPTGNRWFGWWYNRQDCVSLDRKKGMYDDNCDDEMPFICEREVVSSR